MFYWTIIDSSFAFFPLSIWGTCMSRNTVAVIVSYGVIFLFIGWDMTFKYKGDLS